MLQVELNLWWFLVLVPIVGIILWNKLSRYAKEGLILIFIIVFLLAIMLVPIYTIYYSETYIHKHLEHDEKEHISLWEKLTLKQVPFEEIQRRMNQEILEKNEYRKTNISKP